MLDWLRRLLALPEQGSALAREVDHLHFLVIGVTMLGWMAVTLLAIWLAWRYRERPGTPRTGVGKGVRKFELVLGAFTLSLFLFFWVLGYRQYVRMQTSPPDASVVYVTGKQWMWKFAYPDGRSAVEVLTLPAGRPVKLVMTSRDVIHSFYVPAFRVKQDVLPGRFTTLWLRPDRAGEYQVFCAEYCGLDHSMMRGTVRVLEPSKYEEWLAASATSSPSGLSQTGESLASQGERLATRHACTSCHRVDGQPHIGPSFKGLYGSQVKLSDGTTVQADEAYITRSMMDPSAQVAAGYQPVMPTYRGRMDAGDVGAIVEFIRSLRDDSKPPAVVAPMPVGKSPQELLDDKQ